MSGVKPILHDQGIVDSIIACYVPGQLITTVERYMVPADFELVHILLVSENIIITHKALLLVPKRTRI